MEKNMENEMATGEYIGITKVRVPLNNGLL